MKKKISLLLSVVILCMLCSINVCAAGKVKDGTYSIAGTLQGGTHGVTMKSPTTLKVVNGAMTVEVVMSKKNYTVMKLGGAEYDNETPGSNSTFTIPVAALDTPIAVSATTVAMSQPHDIDYTITLDSKSLPAEAFVATEPESKADAPAVNAPVSSQAASTEASTTVASSTEASKAAASTASSTESSKERKAEDNQGNGTLIAVIVVVVVVVVGAAVIAVLAKKKIKK